jgi:hypothetical protein
MKPLFKRFLIAALLPLMVSFAPPAAGGALTDYLENRIVDWLFRGQSFTPPATLYVSLHTSACSDSSTGTEVSGGSYARVGVAANTTNWANTQNSGTGASTGTSGTTRNKVTITFPAPTANWGSITHFGIWDASSGGNMLICAALTQAKTVNNGDAAPAFAVDALTVQIDN